MCRAPAGGHYVFAESAVTIHRQRVAVLHIRVVRPIANTPRLPDNIFRVAPVWLARYGAEVIRKPIDLHAMHRVRVAYAARWNCAEMRRVHHWDCIQETISNAETTQCAQHFIQAIEVKDHRSIP